MTNLCSLKGIPFRYVLNICAVIAAMQFTGCASVTLPDPEGTASNVEKLKIANPAPMTVGEFKVAPGKATAADRGLNIRGTNSISPAGGSFAIQLRDQLAAELKAAGLESTSAKVVVSGVVTDNALEAGISTGNATLAARFQVRRDDKVTFEKEIAVTSTWESSFVAAIAVPTAFNNYGTLFKDLIGKLLDDPEFRSAVKS